MNYKLLGEKIRESRKNKKYTLEQLAEKIDVSTTFIGQIERAKGIPSLETFVNIVNSLDISADYLLFGDLKNEAGNSQFVNQIKQLTENFSPEQKESLLKIIVTLQSFKNN